MSSEDQPSIVRPGEEKFTLPEIPVFSERGPWWSALSLLLFFITSFVGFRYLSDASFWLRLPLLFTMIGSGIGFVYELWLIASGRPYLLFLTANGRLVQMLRAVVLVFVFTSTYFAYCLLTFGNTSSCYWLAAVVGVLASMLYLAFVLQAPPTLAAVAQLLGAGGQVALVCAGLYGFSNQISNEWGIIYLSFAAISLYTTSIAGVSTPERSTSFHILAICSAIFYVQGVILATISAELTLIGSIWGMLGCLLGGFVLATLLGFWAIPLTWNRLRAGLASATWPFFYLIIAGGLRPPRPERLSQLYKGKEDQLEPLKVYPYYIAHPRNLSHQVSVPALDEALTLKVHALGLTTRLVKFFFAVASIANRLFPFANIRTPIRDKPRMEVWNDGRDYWPRWLLRTIWLPGLGRFQIQSGVRGPGFQPSPELAVEYYHEGQFLAYLAEFGIAGSFLQAESGRRNTRLVLDFSFLEKYETKEDYESYGGKAFFRIDDDRQRLVLESVIAPASDTEIQVNPNDDTFRRAEDMILASLYFYVVSGKHLVEIHMGLNLIEIALFNAFDANKQWGHPVRMALYPHLYAHELAEELTTQNLLEDGAVFPQIFATTNAALVNHLNDRFSEYELGKDENFEAREQVLLTGRKKELEAVLPNSSLVWEKRYAKIWQEYAKSIVEAAYKDDEEVAEDECVQSLLRHLEKYYPTALPERYGKLSTMEELIRFIGDTIHHLVIRHEVYGTTGVRLSLDPRINKVQVPKDGGPPAIDEWRSLACVAMATSRVRYTSLTETNFSNVFYDVQDPIVRSKMQKAHQTMKSELQKLETEFQTDGVDNYQQLRPLPSELDIGAGY
ncbi:MAG: hypothetical protein AAF394_01700 [Planctomycetota bacterium]